MENDNFNNWENFNPCNKRRNGVKILAGREECALEQALKALRANIEFNVPEEYRKKIEYIFTWNYKP